MEIVVDVERLKRELRRAVEIGQVIYEDDEIEVRIVAVRKRGPRW